MISGLLPVGRPNTKGFSGVGLKRLIRPDLSVFACKNSCGRHTDDILSNVFGDTLRVFPDDDSPAA